MGFLLSHWHCILPAVLLMAAFAFTGKGGKEQDNQDEWDEKNTREPVHRERLDR